MTNIARLVPALIAGLLLPGAAAAAPRCTQEADGAACVWGRAEAFDGQTLQVRGLRIHLLGIDVPNRKDLCGVKGGASFDCAQPARKRMGELVAKGGVACDILDAVGGALMARCKVNDGDLAELMALSGVALAKDGPYAEASAQALAARRGLWAEGSIAPKDWEALRSRAEKKDKPAP